MQIRLLSVIAFLGVTFPSASQENPAEPPKTGSVAGIVIEEKSGDGVTKATVILRRDQESGIGAISNSEGKFTLRDLEPGTYAITVERDGYVPARGQAQTVNVQAEQTSSDIKLKLVRTAAISGRILDPDGDPISGVSVALSPKSAKKSAPSP